MFAKILIHGTLEVVTGMHIGAGGDYAAIGTADSLVVRDVITNLPMIPGSTLKGKLRSLIVKEYCPESTKPEADSNIIKRMFGGDFNSGSIKKTGRFIFSDSVLSNFDDLKKKSIESPTEVKFENSIVRLTGVANPRQIERVIRGSKFDINITYELENGCTENEAKDDFRILADGLRFLTYDYLGGSGTRGYGKVKFENIVAKTVVGECDFEDSLNSIFEDFKNE
ncbi:MAG: type III-A CRISPR-associated RAMP protein Csm3 [Acutalibacteraceae bacterium]